MRLLRRDRATYSQLSGWKVVVDTDKFRRSSGCQFNKEVTTNDPPPAGAVEIGTAGELGLRDGVAKMSALPRSSQSSSESDSQNLPLTALIGIEEPTSIKSRVNAKSLQSAKTEAAGFTSLADRRRRAQRTAGATTTPDGMRWPATAGLDNQPP
jgi:hypothetical protein